MPNHVPPQVADLRPDMNDPLAALEADDLKRVVARAVGRLPEREQQVIALYYQESMTLKEIGVILGVTESRVSQLQSAALARNGRTPRTDASAVLRETEA